MKKLTIYLLCILGLCGNLNAIDNNRNSNSAESLLVNSNDIIAALKEAGIQIFKFDPGEFKTKQNLVLLLEEFSNDSLVSQEVLYRGTNRCTSFDDQKQRIEKYIDMIRVITTVKDNKCKLAISMNEISLNREFDFSKTYNRQFYVWRKYSNSHWKLNERTPILAFISSWKNKRGFIRCCGPKELKEEDEKTIKFYSDSPSYFILSYMVEALE